jgi:hypothetical protein
MKMGRGNDQDFIDEHRLFIAIAEACHRKEKPSYSWHILDWMSWKLRRKYPLVRKCDSIISIDGCC